MAKIHIHEIEPELSSSEIDGTEVLVVSNPNGLGYDTSKLTLNSLADFVNSSSGSNILDRGSLIFDTSGYTALLSITVSSTTNIFCIGVDTNASVNYFRPAPVCNISGCEITAKFRGLANSSTPSQTMIDNCVLDLRQSTPNPTLQISADGSQLTVGNVQLNRELFTYLKIITNNAIAETIEGGWNLKEAT